MNNSCYGKALESKRNHVNVNLLLSREAVLNSINKNFGKSIKFFDENLVAVTSRGVEFFGIHKLLWELVYWILPNITCSGSIAT